MAFIPQAIRANEAQVLINPEPAGEIISALRAVRLTTNGEYVYADRTGTYEEATAIGVSLNSGGVGIIIRAQLAGVLEDPFFTFPLDALLFLDDDGIITDAVPVVGHRVLIGKSLGSGKIYVDFKEPIIL
jgi:hypothetical protein